MKLLWDHEKHTRNFTHGESTLPELILYQGHGYYKAFCTRVRKSYDDAVAFAFSSAFSVSPDNIQNKAAVISDGKETDDEDAGPLLSHLVEDNVVEWYSPPPLNVITPSLALIAGNAVPKKPLL